MTDMNLVETVGEKYVGVTRTCRDAATAMHLHDVVAFPRSRYDVNAFAASVQEYRRRGETKPPIPCDRKEQP